MLVEPYSVTLLGPGGVLVSRPRAKGKRPTSATHTVERPRESAKRVWTTLVVTWWRSRIDFSAGEVLHRFPLPPAGTLRHITPHSSGESFDTPTRPTDLVRLIFIRYRTTRIRRTPDYARTATRADSPTPTRHATPESDILNRPGPRPSRRSLLSRTSTALLATEPHGPEVCAHHPPTPNTTRPVRERTTIYHEFLDSPMWL